MAEPMFGTVSPVWSAVPFPGLAWFQAPMAGNRAMGSPPGSAGVTSGMMTSMPAGTSPGFGAGPSTVVSTPVAAPFPPVFTPDIAGVTAPALVMAVAIRTGPASRPDQRSGDRGLHLRRARSLLRRQRRGGALRQWPDDPDRQRVSEAAQAGCGRNCLGHPQHQRRAEQHHDCPTAALAYAGPRGRAIGRRGTQAGVARLRCVRLSDRNRFPRSGSKRGSPAGARFRQEPSQKEITAV